MTAQTVLHLPLPSSFLWSYFFQMDVIFYFEKITQIWFIITTVQKWFLLKPSTLSILCASVILLHRTGNYWVWLMLTNVFWTKLLLKEILTSLDVSEQIYKWRFCHHLYDIESTYTVLIILTSCFYSFDVVFIYLLFTFSKIHSLLYTSVSFDDAPLYNHYHIYW